MQEVTTGMREKGINNMTLIDREESEGKKNKTLGRERCENIDSVYKNKYA